MRKFFQDYSASGVALIFSVIIFGFLFRLLGLSDASAWGDEIASLFYANNLGDIFYHESHTPLYYFICKIWMLIFGESIVALRYLFVLLSAFLLFISGMLLLRKKETGFLLLFITLWWLWPTDIIFSRQARHYGLYAELSFFYLIFWRYKDDFSSGLTFVIGSFVQFFHPFMLVPVLFLAIFDFLRKQLSRKKLMVVLSSGLPVLIYYLARFSLFGFQKVMSNIDWIRLGFVQFLKDLFLMAGGDSHPLNVFYPLSVTVTFVFLALVALVLLFRAKLKESWSKFLIILILSVALTEMISQFFSNIRVARYSIYLLPFFLYALLDSVEQLKPKVVLVKAGLLALLLISYNILIFKPWSYYEWDDQNVSNVIEKLKSMPPKELVVCGNRYQLDYYFKKPNLTCTQVAFSLLNAKKPFYLFDINGNDNLLLIYILQEAEITSNHTFMPSRLITVEPRR